MFLKVVGGLPGIPFEFHLPSLPSSRVFGLTLALSFGASGPIVMRAVPRQLQRLVRRRARSLRKP